MKLGQLRKRIDMEEVKWLVEAVRLKLHLDTGKASMVEYCMDVLGHDPRTAQERVRVAEDLALLPVMRDAIEKGEVTWTSARHLTRVVKPATEAAWVGFAKGKSVAEVKDECRGREEGDLPGAPRDESNKIYTITLELTAEQFASFKAAKEAVLKEAETQLEEGAVLARLAMEFLTPTPAVEGAARTVQHGLIMEHCPDCAKGWEISNGQKVQVDTAAIMRRLCDAKILNGREFEFAALEIPRPIRRKALARDKHRCTVPGCRNHRWVELHHIIPVSELGPHTMENLTTLCWTHHYLHHEGLLLITGRAGIDLKFESVDVIPAWARPKADAILATH